MSITIGPAVAAVNEGSECYANLSFFDQSGAGYVPTALSYRVDSPRYQQNVVPWTVLPPPFAATWVIVITAAQNAKLGPEPMELRRITVKITAPGGALRNDSQTYALMQIPALM